MPNRLSWEACRFPERPLDELTVFTRGCRGCSVKVLADSFQPSSYFQPWQTQDLMLWCGEHDQGTGWEIHEPDPTFPVHVPGWEPSEGPGSGDDRYGSRPATEVA